MLHVRSAFVVCLYFAAGSPAFAGKPFDLLQFMKQTTAVHRMPEAAPDLSNYVPGTIVIATSLRRLYFILPHGKVKEYPIGVGRTGFAWSGRYVITRKAEWPSWYPPKEMLERQPYLPRMMAGSPANPLGARALYVGNTLYRIHGTNNPKSIGKAVSSGCIRMLNRDVIELYSLVEAGKTPVVAVR